MNRDYSVPLILACVLLLITLTLVSSVLDHVASIDEKLTQGWTPPDIEQCDKALWDRIRHEC